MSHPGETGGPAGLRAGYLILLFVVVSAASPGSAQEQSEPSPRWQRVVELEAGQFLEITIRKPFRKELGKKIKGHFVAADAAGVTNERKDGTSQTIAKQGVRRIRRKTKGKPWAPWAGLGAGAVLGIALASGSGDLTASGVVVLGTLYFGGPGAGVGYLVHRLLIWRVVYQRAPAG